MLDHWHIEYPVNEEGATSDADEKNINAPKNGAPRTEQEELLRNNESRNGEREDHGTNARKYKCDDHP